MALVYRLTGDSPNAFEVITDGVVASDPSGNSVLPNEFHITEVRNLTEFDVANGMNVIVEETTRREFLQLAEDNGYTIEELDDQDSLSTTEAVRITSFSPARGGTSTLTENIVLTFSENIAKAAATGPRVVLLNLTTNAVVQTFPYNASTITVATNVATINPSASLVNENKYALLISKGYFTNTGATLDHGGINDVNFYTFTAGS